MIRLLPDRALHAIDSLGAMFESRPAAWGALAVIGLAYAVVASVIGVAQFSPDSWSYYELAKTVFSGDFYRFNTVRSHFSAEYSASFPMGYPVALAVTQLVFGRVPEIATFLNIAVAAGTVPVVIKIADALRLPRAIGTALGFSLVLFPYYADEVLAGRAIPLAILLVGLAALAVLREAHFLSGLLLGLSALVRFDFLAHSLILLAAVTFLRWRGAGSLARSISGYVIGVSPWIAYSRGHFDTWWVSDNSWVALSALPAFVLDYPAKAVVAASDDLGLWTSRVAGNIEPLLRTLGSAVARYPLAPVLLAIVLAGGKGAVRLIDGRRGVGLALLALATLPYLLAGYVDARYFALHLLCLSLLLTSGIAPHDGRIFGLSIRGAVAIALVVALGICGHGLLHSLVSGYRHGAEMRRELALIASLQRCQGATPSVMYLFEPASRVDYFKYGALTGLRTAGLPSNFDAMSEARRSEFFADITPVVRIAEPPGAGTCPK